MTELTFGNKSIVFNLVEQMGMYYWEAEYNEDHEPDFTLILDQNGLYYVWFDALPGSRTPAARLQGKGETPQKALNDLENKLKANYNVLAKYLG